MNLRDLASASLAKSDEPMPAALPFEGGGRLPATPEHIASSSQPAGAGSALTVMLERSTCATLVCDRDARVLAVNPPADELLRRGDGIALRHTTLTIADSNARRRFRSAVQAVRPDGAVEHAVLIPRPSRKPAYQALLHAGRPWDGSEALWTIVISDPCEVPPQQLRAITELYGLTPAETRVAQQLMMGATVNEAAARICVGTSTVRSHLRRLLAKTGARRQSELVRLFSAVPFYS